MTKIIGAPTLDDALVRLGEWAREGEERGERNLIFCEDRLTLLSERAVLHALGGTFRTEVSTFARFLSGEQKVLSKQGSIMQISAILSGCEGELSCFRKNAAQTVYETLAQLYASRVDGALLRESATETDGLLQKKLLDLALVQEKYAAFLEERGLLDESGYLSLLPEKIESELRGVNVCFFAFPSFTRQAQEGIRAAVQTASSVTGIFVAGRSDFYTNEGASVFRRVCEEYGEAQSSMLECGLEGAALTLHGGLFAPESFSRSPQNTEQVKIFEAQDVEAEIRTVAALIKQEIGEGNARYRDIALLVSGEDTFPVVEKVFSAYQIPYFADKKRAFVEHPFCRLTLALLRGAHSGVLPEEADEIASSVYFGNGDSFLDLKLDEYNNAIACREYLEKRGNGDSYRNYLIRYGAYRGAVKREIKEGEAVDHYNRAELVRCRERMLSYLAPFPKKGSVSVYVQAIKTLYELCDGERLTNSLIAQRSGAEGEFLKTDSLWRLLEEMDYVAGGEKLTAREFALMLESGLKASSVSLIPQYADAVFVGDIAQSKFARVKVLFASGLTDEIPRCTSDSAVITDGEIKRLSTLQVEIEPAIAQVNARARESIALNLCAFTDRLYLSYPLRRGDEETSKSEIISYARALFDCTPLKLLPWYECCEAQPARLKLFELRDRIEGGHTGVREQFEQVYAALLSGTDGAQVQTLFEGKGKENITSGERIYFGGRTVSPTLLESYFACPYKGFLLRGLNVRERESRSSINADAGNFVHAVLENLAHHLNTLTSDEECRVLARKLAVDLMNTPQFSSLKDTKVGEYTAERLIEESVTVSAVCYEQLRQSEFVVHKLEESVKLPSLSLSGNADRIDKSGEYTRVIDYKTGEFDDAPTPYYVGQRLQLELYLKGAGGQPAGAFYFPAADEFTSSSENKFRLRGFYNADDEVVQKLDVSLGEDEKSTLFDGGRGKGKGNKGMRGEDFVRFLDYATLVSAQAEREMKEGNVAPSPYDGACDYCELKGACGYDGEVRKSESVTCDDIVKIVRQTIGEEE